MKAYLSIPKNIQKGLAKKVGKGFEHFPSLTFVWAKAHSSNKYNELVDGFAKKAIYPTPVGTAHG